MTKCVYFVTVNLPTFTGAYFCISDECVHGAEIISILLGFSIHPVTQKDTSGRFVLDKQWVQRKQLSLKIFIRDLSIHVAFQFHLNFLNNYSVTTLSQVDQPKTDVITGLWKIPTGGCFFFFFFFLFCFERDKLNEWIKVQFILLLAVCRLAITKLWSVCFTKMQWQNKLTTGITGIVHIYVVTTIQNIFVQFWNV